MKAYARALSFIKNRRSVFYRWAHVILPLALLLSLAGVRVSGSPWVELVQHRSFDTFLRSRPRPYEPAPVRIVDIDEESLKRLGQWPWPRTLLAQLVRRLDEAGAAAIAFDMVFPEPDRTSPALISAAWPRDARFDAARKTLGGLPDHDAAFARAIARSPVVLGFALRQRASPNRPDIKAGFAAAGELSDHLPAYEGAVTNLPALEKAATGVGIFSTTFERDGVIRRVPLLAAIEEMIVPSLAAEALRVAQPNVRQYRVMTATAAKKGRRQQAGLARLKIGELEIPTDAQGRIWVYYTHEAAQRTIPAWRLFDPKADLAELGGAIAFVGTSAEGLKDLRATPLNAAAPGVEVHANIAEQAILGKFLRRPDWADGFEILYMVFLGLLLALLLPRFGAAACLPLAAAGFGGALGLSWWFFTEKGYLVDPVFPAATTLAVYMASSIVSYLKSETERRQVKGAFSRYMSPALVEELARHPEKLRLGGETREMTFHFCDIRGFTTISEQFDPHGLTQFINRFLTPMTEIILENGGVIDKYMGDCIMAFWNAPLDDPHHARHGCTAALAMHAALAGLNEEWKAQAEAEGRKFVRVEIGTGLNTGCCVVGNMGSDQRFDYSVLGDDVNLASRLEGQSKNYGVPIVIGQNTRDQTLDFAAVELDQIKVKGKTVPVRIYALLGGPEMLADPLFEEQAKLHGEMLACYRQQRWDRARDLLERCRAGKLPLGKLYDLYEQRLDAFAAAPPDAQWDGTFTATSK